MGVEAVAWLVLGLTTIVASAFAHRSRRAMLVGRAALGVLFTFAGALVNALYLATGTDYGGFADASYLAFVRDTWQAVVAPNQALWIGLLVVFEATVGIMVVLGGRATQVALVAMIGFHVALLSFGWFFYAWSLPMLIALVLLLRAERAAPVVAEAGPRDFEELRERVHAVR